MTRSELNPHSPRVVRKAFRAQAKTAGLTYREAILKAKADAATEKHLTPAGVIRRNPGRMDGVQWNGDSFVCASQVDGDDVKVEVTGVEEQDEDLAAEMRVPEEKVVVSLMDIARPAKRRGTAKKYVVLPAIRRVKSFNDDAQSEQWEQWEEGSEAWETQSERWETQSEQWEIPEGDYDAEQWEEMYEEMSRAQRRGDDPTAVELAAIVGSLVNV
ncbi:hypothetical protein FB45DRAFT_922888 [Roridomyces roridus]|uniref:Uncharacterized protein n=1 Tax=Roridomyces roridus TaxID=1738132 RepID=A0AAD7FLR2_9AGAR|nr:hypothetical protein FB45DRAFT_922888 [Roridomyces roridus]